MDEGIDKKDNGQSFNQIQDPKDLVTLENSLEDEIVKETEDTEDIIKSENSQTHPVQASPPSPPSAEFECYFKGWMVGKYCPDDLPAK